MPRPTSLGARGALPREVGTLIPPLRVPAGALAPPAAPSPRAGRARDWQTSDALRRENAEVWLFETSIGNLSGGAFLTSPRSFAGRGRRASSDARRVRGQALRCQTKNLSGRKVCHSTSTTRESVGWIYRSASPLTRSLRCASASTSPRKSGARLKNSNSASVCRRGCPAKTSAPRSRTVRRSPSPSGSARS